MHLMLRKKITEKTVFSKSKAVLNSFVCDYVGFCFLFFKLSYAIPFLQALHFKLIKGNQVVQINHAINTFCLLEYVLAQTPICLPSQYALDSQACSNIANIHIKQKPKYACYSIAFHICICLQDMQKLYVIFALVSKLHFNLQDMH